MILGPINRYSSAVSSLLDVFVLYVDDIPFPRYRTTLGAVLTNCRLLSALPGARISAQLQRCHRYVLISPVWSSTYPAFPVDLCGFGDISLSRAGSIAIEVVRMGRNAGV